MATCALDLPVNIPWKLIAASADMMDTRFCNKLFPFAWRSSLALSVYEPGPEDVPDGLCGQRLAYLKVTCSITGYQPSKEETGQIVDYFGDDPTEDQRAILDQILAEYFACYGVLLNVAVFPGPRAIYKEVPIDFARLPETRPGSTLPNPIDVNGTRFDADGATSNRLIDIVPSGGDGQAELELPKKLTVTFPPGVTVGKVAANIAHFSASGVTMEAFQAGVSLGSTSTGPAQNTVHALVLFGDGIDRVVFTAPDNHAGLLLFTYGMPAGESTDTHGIPLDDFPHILDFEPKLRDLYQAATDSGEVLSDSKSGVKTDKSFTHTESTQNSLSLGIEAPLGDSGLMGKAETSTVNTDTDQSQWAVQADASRERRETQSTSTQISQMYNLLTGYHVGTNRAVFLMLARPHVLQPTDFRTFVQGLRAIEGVQEFFIIVSRPQDMEGLCVEVWLETGHFPEDAPITQPTPEYDEAFEDFPVTKSASGGWFSSDCADIDMEYTVAGGWVIDRRPARGADPGHPGIAMIEDRSNGAAKDSLKNYNYLPSADSTVSITGHICGDTGLGGGDDANFDRTYRVFTRSEQPKPTGQQPSASLDRLVITARELCVCFRSKDACPEVLPQPHRGGQQDRNIVAEPMVRISPILLTPATGAGSRTPAMKAFLRQVERSMSNSWRLPKRYPLGEVGFLDSEFFKDRITKALPPEVLRRPLAQVPDAPREVVGAIGERATVGDLLALDLAQLARKTGMTLKQAADARARLLHTQASAAGRRE